MVPTKTYGSKKLENMYQKLTEHEFFAAHIDTIQRTLHEAGADAYDMALPETHILPLIIHPFETIEGVVYGRYKQEQLGTDTIIGRGALLATDQRIMLVDKKPLFVRCDEISYGVISGITYSKVVFAGTVTLHTRMGDIIVRTFNQVCAHNFVEAVEQRIFNQAKEEGDDTGTPTWPVQAN